jgi:hypothetical protein
MLVHLSALSAFIHSEPKREATDFLLEMPKATTSKTAKSKKASVPIPEVVAPVEPEPMIEEEPVVEVEAAVEPVVEPVVEAEPIAPAKVKKTPGAKRVPKNKQISVVATVSANGDIQGSFSPEPRRPLIAHLPFRTSEVQFQDGPLIYDPRPPVVPQPYDANEDDLFQSGVEHLAAFDDDAKTSVSIQESGNQIPSVAMKEAVVEQAPIKAFKTLDMMIEYKVANETQTLPESVCAACFWCAGTFEGRPVVLPTKEEYGVYTVYGNFCTVPCSLSYLLNEQVDPQVRWERQALMHRMYKQSEPIQPAPPRESLRFFGGALTHDQFRSIIEKRQIRIDSHLPPVISILATLDTKPIDFYETSLRNTTATGAGLEITKPMEAGLRLKRSKPLKDKESTLDAVMNLQVRAKN